MGSSVSPRTEGYRTRTGPAVIDVAKATTNTSKKPEYTCRFVVTVALYDYHMVLALAMGADFLLMGRYFARFDESPTEVVGNSYVKEYWGKVLTVPTTGNADMGSSESLKFEEGVDSYVLCRKIKRQFGCNHW
ncbi:MAG: IMP dehydrogenase [Butyricimonas faecalis]